MSASDHDTNKSRPLCTIVIPVYKSTQSLAEIAGQIKVLEENSPFNFELIFVNDSPFFAPTRDALAEVEKKYAGATMIELRKNQGQHLATIVGMGFARGEYVINMDDDLQHPVKEIPRLIGAMQEDPSLDAIFAVPGFDNRKHSWWKVLGSYARTKIDTIFLNAPKGLVKSSFRIMTKRMAQLLTQNYNATPSISSLIICYTQRVKNITVEHHPRPYGKSSYGFGRLFSLSLNNILHYSAFPLKMVGIVGLITFIFTIGFVTITIARKLMFNISVPGFTTIIALTGLLGGMNLLAVGIIGEYLLRILKEQQKPKIGDLVDHRCLPEKPDCLRDGEEQPENLAEKQS